MAVPTDGESDRLPNGDWNDGSEMWGRWKSNEDEWEWPGAAGGRLEGSCLSVVDVAARAGVALSAGGSGELGGAGEADRLDDGAG